MRLFLDANILFSAAYRDESPAALLIDLACSLEVAVLTSRHAADEARRNIGAKAPHGLAEVDRHLGQIALVPEAPQRAVDLATELGLPPKDAPVLAAAWAARATHLVTGDRRHFGHLYGSAVRGVRVVPLRTALTMLVRRAGA